MTEARIYRLGAGIVTDDWQQPDAGVSITPGASVIVDLERWRSEADALAAGAGRIGLRLPNTEDVEALGEQITRLPLIALEFPAFTDGRAFSQARLLREYLGFAGELRACGDILTDQMLYMARCGFDAFELPAGASPERIEAALGEFSVAYQTTASGPQLRPAG